MPRRIIIKIDVHITGMTWKGCLITFCGKCSHQLESPPNKTGSVHLGIIHYSYINYYIQMYLSCRTDNKIKPLVLMTTSPKDLTLFQAFDGYKILDGYGPS